MANYDLGLFTPAWRYLTQLGPKGKYVSGPLKAAQRFCSAFLTERGSVLYRPDYGSEFLYYIRFSMIRTDSDVILYFNMAVADALEYVNAVETDNNVLPDDEAIASVELERFELEQPSLILYIVITMRSGDSVAVTLPVTAAEEVDNAN